ncbi:WD40/YVTN/BNR-like repeat-containing protein [Archangium violaceum]|uniref:WD40/YVTN/BNR-like repeat-containing protein n=1 Tax=Archangium violaceum TaxID=83451 RepID=UPI0036D9C523
MNLLSSLRRALLLLAPLALYTPPALAHLGFPDTTSVTIRRGHPEDMFLGATFGALISRDTGKTWRWICPEAMSYGGWRPETFLWQPDGTLLAATGAALIRSTDGGCTWTVHNYFKSQGLWPSGLASPASNPSRLWVTTNRGASRNGVYRSDDGGQTFTPVMQSDTIVYTAVKVAPSDSRRIYVSGGTITDLRIYRSDDEGEHWEELPQPFPQFPGPRPPHPYDLFVLKVSDTNPDRLWARVSWQNWTYVLESKDGGRTFTSVVHPEGEAQDGLGEYLIGIEVSADGNTLWAATHTRLFRVRAGETYATQLPLPDGNACAQREGDVLYVCGASRLHDWALATTTDDGQTYTPLFNLPDTKPPTCPAGTPTHDICRPYWPQFAPTIEADPTLPPEETPDAGTPPDGGSPGIDAGTDTSDAGTTDPKPDEPQPPPKKGCSSASGLVPAACLLVLSTLRRTRRRNPEN